MTKYIYYRMLGYVVTIALHVSNMVVMAQPKPKEVLEDPRVKAFGQLQRRYFTVWTFFLQVVYAVSGLLCDVLLLINSSKRNYQLPKYVRGFRDTLFSAVIWPSTLIVFSIFWTVFLYDRSLIFPDFLDKVLSPVSNHIMHTAILPIILWEVFFRPQTNPKSHMRNLGHLVFHLALYLSVLVYTYVERGSWIYPIITKLYGTVYFFVIMLSVLLLGITFYYTQWIIVSILWKVSEKPKRKVR